jgi:uncharacterized protein
MSDIEIRSLVEPIEFRSDEGRMVATGTAIRYGALSKNMGGFVERVMPGAAVKALENRNVAAFHEHVDRTKLLGTTEAGTLRLVDSPTELRYEIDLPDTTAGRDAAVLLERRDLRGASYGFRSNRATDQWTRAKDGLALRSIVEFNVFDHIALTVAPAFSSSTSELALRSLADATGLELRSILDAAEHRELANLIDPEHREEIQPPRPTDDAPIVSRQRIGWMHA